MSDLCNIFGELPRTSQPVEKVFIGPVGGPDEATNKTKNTTKEAYLASEPGAEMGAKGFFNTLGRSTHSGE